MTILFTSLLLVALVAASAFFSSSETALLSISRVQLRQMMKDKMVGARRVATLKSDMDGLLTTILIGNNFVNNLASSAATALAVSLFGQLFQPLGLRQRRRGLGIFHGIQHL